MYISICSRNCIWCELLMIRRVSLTRVPVTGSVSISVCVSVIALCFSLACGLIDVPWRRSKGAPGDDVTALATAVKAVMEKYGVSSLATADSTVIQPQRRLGNLFMALQWLQPAASCSVGAPARVCVGAPARAPARFCVARQSSGSPGGTPQLLDRDSGSALAMGARKRKSPAAAHGW